MDIYSIVGPNYLVNIPGKIPSAVHRNDAPHVQSGPGLSVHALPTQYWLGDEHVTVCKGVGTFAAQI